MWAELGVDVSWISTLGLPVTTQSCRVYSLNKWFPNHKHITYDNWYCNTYHLALFSDFGFILLPACGNVNVPLALTPAITINVPFPLSFPHLQILGRHVWEYHVLSTPLCMGLTSVYKASQAQLRTTPTHTPMPHSMLHAPHTQSLWLYSLSLSDTYTYTNATFI